VRHPPGARADQADDGADAPQQQGRDERDHGDQDENLTGAGAVEQEEVRRPAGDVEQRLGDGQTTQGGQLQQREELGPRSGARADGR
jgi:hypothetical protein